MTYIEIITAIVILGFFLSGFSQVYLPMYNVREKVLAEYRTIEAIRIIDESFRKECNKTDRDMEDWKKNITTIKELDDLEIIELKENEITRALMAKCNVSGEHIEIIGLCAP